MLMSILQGLRLCSVGVEQSLAGFFFFLVMLPQLPAQPGHRTEWEYFGPAKGMGMSFNVIHQDRQGFLWLGSTNGLYRYDGYELRFFKKYTSHPSGLSSDWIWDLQEDEKGNIWIGTYSGGLNKWDRQSGAITHFRHNPSDTNSLSGRMVLKMRFDHQGFLWMVTKKEGAPPSLDKLDPKTGIVKRYSNSFGQPIRPSLFGQPSANLNTMVEDSLGDFWIATNDGLLLYDPQSDDFIHFTHNPEQEGTLSYPQVTNIYPSPHNPDHIWVASANADLTEGAIDLLKLKTHKITNLLKTKAIDDNAPMSLWQPADQPNVLWFTASRLHRIHLPSGEVATYSLDFPLSGNPQENLFSLTATRSGQFWINPIGMDPSNQVRGSDNYRSIHGIQHFDPQTGASKYYGQHPTDAALPFPPVRSLLEDNSGNLWVGAFIGFFRIWPQDNHGRQPPEFTNFALPSSPIDQSLPSNLRDVVQVDDSLFWLASFNGGLHLMNRNEGLRRSFLPGRSSLRNGNVYALHIDNRNGWLWIGHGTGLDRLPLKASGSGSFPFEAVRDEAGLLDTRINTIQPADSGMLWIGTGSKGLLLFDPAEEKVLEQYIPRPDQSFSLPDSFVNEVYTDGSGRLWVAPNMQGCCLMEGRGADARFQCFLEGLYIVDFQEVQDTIWMAAMNYGIVRFHPADHSYDLLTMDNRLLRNTATGIEADSLGRIWFTSLGLGRYDPEKDGFQFFGRQDGLLDLDPERCFFKAANGDLFYAGVGGSIQLFDPDRVKDNPVPPKVVLTSFKLFNEELSAGSGSPLPVNIEVADTIRLAHDQNSFSVEFAGLEFTAPEKNQYKYMLEGLEGAWQFAGSSRVARYNKVPPGTYHFKVFAANSDGVWSEQPSRLAVLIAPPWWRTWWAFLLFWSLVAALFLLTFRIQQRRWRLQTQLAMEHKEAERLKELDAAKNHFFTNITHEFRTPLTIIQGVSDQIPVHHEQQETGKVREDVDMVKRNSDSLLRLVNQLLDLAKLESGSLSLEKGCGDVTGFLRFIVASFQSLADYRGIALRFHAPDEELIMDYDPDKLQKIVNNLLSNALKFTPPEGKIDVTLEHRQQEKQETAILRVADTGVGLDPSQQALVFDRFYQADPSATRRGQGTGIGLTLTSELVKLMGGNIRLNSGKGTGSIFTVELPVTREAPAFKKPRRPEASPPATATRKENLKDHGGSESPLVLIVEDNQDVIRYLSDGLSNQYRIAQANDGKEGIRMAKKLNPDLIISDVMMPEVDGLELCQTLKSDPGTSHIPIILLTARSTDHDRLLGLERGADAYLVKPFQLEELQLRMANLITTREQMRRRYEHPGLSTEKNRLPEDAFIVEARKIVEREIDNPDFGAEDLAAALNLSRTQVHRKLRYLTGKSTTYFIRMIRMQRALELLRTTQMNISEVAFAVGFRDPSYFSRVFSQVFGHPPSGIRD